MLEFTQDFYDSIKDELFSNILPYWEKYSRDTVNTGFFGVIDNENNCNAASDRIIVMTSRFLWTYSAVARLTKNPKYLEMADFAYDVIINKYWDKKNGGVYWSIMPDGTPKVSKKQIYGEAFCCYGLSEYAAAVKELKTSPNAAELAEEAMNHALDIYNLLETYARDPDDGGYVEARAMDWKPTTDMILSSKDMNCPKSMNTNIHVMEAFTTLYRNIPVVFPDAGAIQQEVGESLRDLIFVTTDFILQPNGHLGMFFDMNWHLLCDEISYGHDIEVSWLLWEAACELKDEEVKSQIRDIVLKVASVSLEEGFDSKDGCMENSLKDNGKLRDRTRVWWIQAETMNGFYNAWEMTGDKKYSDACKLQWQWIKNYQIDKKNGEWWNELNADGSPKLNESKGGNWKTSYHNGRTCMELLKRSNNF